MAKNAGKTAGKNAGKAASTRAARAGTKPSEAAALAGSTDLAVDIVSPHPGHQPARAIPQGGRLKVRALAQCFVDNGRRREGDVFTVDRKDFNPKCMEPVDASTREQITGPNAAIAREHDAILGGKITSATPAASPADAGVLGDD